MNLRTTFKAHNVTFEILARSSRKKGISVFGRKKVGNAKFQLGLRTVFPMSDEDGALKRYTAMVDEAKAAGWQVAATRTGSVGTFSTMPAPPTAAVEQTEPDAKPVGGGKGNAAKAAKVDKKAK